jgi:hypothetical protein
MKGIGTSETFTYICQTVRRHVPEDNFFIVTAVIALNVALLPSSEGMKNTQGV